jgi:general stress protein 26
MMRIDDTVVLNILRQSMVARIATVSRHGRPSVNPLYFVYQDGLVWLGTAVWTLAAHNVKANPQVCLLLEIEQETGTKRTLRLTGKASVRTDREIIRSYGFRVARKYVLTAGWIRNALVHFRQLGLQRQYRAQSKRKGQTCVIEFTPEFVELISNDHQHC